MHIILVGATGLVGTEMIRVLEELQFPVTNFTPVASKSSIGKFVTLNGKAYPVVTNEMAIQRDADIALFSAGSSTSLKWAPKYAEKGIYVIDNSSAWRMDKSVPLVVPEINGELLNKDNTIIANPNCSTIQMVVALAQLHKHFKIKRIIVSTYQSFTGTGVQAVKQYEAEKAGLTVENPAYTKPIFANCIPHCDVFLENDYTKEEMKLVHETQKILADSSILVSATAVRVPVFGGHSESINVEFENSFEIKHVFSILGNTCGVEVLDNPKEGIYPTPLELHKKNKVFVGRVRRDETVPNGLNLWVVSDNLRKGAATNAVQIAQFLLDKELLSTT